MAWDSIAIMSCVCAKSSGGEGEGEKEGGVGGCRGGGWGWGKVGWKPLHMLRSCGAVQARRDQHQAVHLAS
jgi:hypothetical protein